MRAGSKPFPARDAVAGPEPVGPVSVTTVGTTTVRVPPSSAIQPAAEATTSTAAAPSAAATRATTARALARMPFTVAANQALQGPAFSRENGRGRVRRRHRRRRGPEDDPDERPARPGLEHDVAAHHRRELACDRKPEPAARGDAALGAVEAIEDVRSVLGRHAGPVVLDVEI